jgi:energy-coupling factor transporter ATP-binding protein EcfA2
MRIIELEIHNIRGICDLSLKPNGKNLVIWGSNGSGKSAVVDAIDFLLTSRISRLTGKGTGDIKLEKHGTHIDHKPEQATVRAVVSIPNYPKPIEIKRCMLNPGNLEYSDPGAKSYLNPILSMAVRGQHVLTRREILKYITAEPSNRAVEIQTILDIREIEDIRKVLVSVENSCEKEFNGAKKALTIATGEITAAVGVKSFEVETVLQWVNAKRALLGAAPIVTLKSTELKANVIAPVFQAKETAINPVELKTNIDNLIKFLNAENLDNLLKVDTELRESLQPVQANPELVRSLKKIRLFQLGIDLLDDKAACPLCDKPWDTQQLKEHIQQHLDEAVLAQKYHNNIDLKSKTLSDALSDALARIKQVINTIEITGLAEEKPQLELWRDNLDQIIGFLASPVEKYKTTKISSTNLRSMIAIPGIESVIGRVSTFVESTHPKTTPQQEAWDSLTKMETRLDSYEKTKELLIRKALVYSRSTTLHETFTASRDSVLKSLYDSVRDRFVELYRQIHKSDESAFKAEIKPEEAGLDFTVDFYGRGSHPPHAMHSEGHQDSMGLCLYLALAEKLTKNFIDLIILDDVVMSVDAEHRRQVCTLLSKEFPRNQFLITTHDRTWANQLRSDNIVDSAGMIQFYNWHVNTGPQVNFQADIWGRIENDLKKDDVSSASGRLRQNGEQFFAMVCDSLQAPVVYKLNASYDFGNLIDGAVAQYRRLLAKAKNAAQSWGKDEEFQKLQEFDSIVKEIYERTNAEKWPINPTIHYNNWANLSKPDFQPVVEAFQDLYAVFVCSKCNKLLHLVTANGRQESVRCDCSQVNWNLVPKEKGTKSQ